MKIEQLRFRAVSHLLESDVDAIYQNVNKNGLGNMGYVNDRQRDEKLYQMLDAGVEEPFVESLFNAFVSDFNKEVNLGQECVKLKFEKIALEDLVVRLRQQNLKKDQVIRSLKEQMKINGVGKNNEQYL